MVKVEIVWFGVMSPNPGVESVFNGVKLTEAPPVNVQLNPVPAKLPVSFQTLISAVLSLV